MTEEKKEGEAEDILTKLTMPGHALREETKQKAKEALEQQGEGAQRLGAVTNTSQASAHEEQPVAIKEKSAEDILTKLTMPGQTPKVEEQVAEKEKPGSSMPQDADRSEVERLAENIFNSDYGEKKKK